MNKKHYKQYWGNVIANTLAPSQTVPVPAPTKRGRPKKNSSVISGYPSIKIIVVANGYMVTVGEDKTANNAFVFANMTALSEWLKDNLRPTYKNGEFMESL